MAALALALVATAVVVIPAGQAAFPGANGKIAFSSNREGDFDIFHMNPDGSGQANLVNDAPSTFYDFRPSYSPDGSKVAFDSNRDGGDGGIYTINADGSGASAELAGGDVHSAAHCGTMIAFVRNLAGNEEIFTMNADGTNPTNVTNNAPADDSQPAWSPDCSMIAFFSFRDGNAEIYTMAATGGSQTNRTMNAAADFAPDWQPLPKVTICHKPGTPAQKTLEVPAQAVAAHLGHGDTLGPCP